jgi:hypothetical protein
MNELCTPVRPTGAEHPFVEVMTSVSNEKQIIAHRISSSGVKCSDRRVRSISRLTLSPPSCPANFSSQGKTTTAASAV